jgi:hypothetical protein
MNHTIEMIGWWRTPDNGYGRKVAVSVRVSQSHRTVVNRCESGSGGDGGIRTLDGLLTHTHFPGERLRPLGHVSAILEKDGAPYRENDAFASTDALQ